MAKKAKTASAKKGEIKGEELVAIVEEHARLVATGKSSTDKASEFFTKRCDTYKLNADALKQAAKIRKMDDNKRPAHLRALLEYLHKLGCMDQIDGFDDIIDTMEMIVEDAKNRVSSDPKQGAFDGLKSEGEAEGASLQ